MLTRVNLSKNGWQGYVGCPFCGKSETLDHLFVQCSFAKTIRNWIPESNNFELEIDPIEELWYIYTSIPLKNKLLIELFRGAILWILWLTRNKCL